MMMSAYAPSTLSHTSAKILPSRLRSNIGLQKSAARRQGSFICRASWNLTNVTVEDVKQAEGGRMVVEVEGKRVLLAVVDDQLYAVSNKCSHLGLPLVGKTKLMQGQVKDKCIVCPAHGTAFRLDNGQVEGAWCPSFPDLPLVGKMTPEKPLETYESRVGDADLIEVNL